MFKSPESGVHFLSPALVSLLNDWNAAISTCEGISIPKMSETCLRESTEISRSALILNFAPLSFSNSAVFSNFARDCVFATRVHGSVDIKDGICQFSEVRAAPPLKKSEKSPP